MDRFRLAVDDFLVNGRVLSLCPTPCEGSLRAADTEGEIRLKYL